MSVHSLMINELRRNGRDEMLLAGRMETRREAACALACHSPPPLPPNSHLYGSCGHSLPSAARKQETFESILVRHSSQEDENRPIRKLELGELDTVSP